MKKIEFYAEFAFGLKNEVTGNVFLKSVDGSREYNEFYYDNGSYKKENGNHVHYATLTWDVSQIDEAKLELYAYVNGGPAYSWGGYKFPAWESTISYAKVINIKLIY